MLQSSPISHHVPDMRCMLPRKVCPAINDELEAMVSNSFTDDCKPREVHPRGVRHALSQPEYPQKLQDPPLRSTCKQWSPQCVQVDRRRLRLTPEQEATLHNCGPRAESEQQYSRCAHVLELSGTAPQGLHDRDGTSRNGNGLEKKRIVQRSGTPSPSKIVPSSYFSRVPGLCQAL